MNAIDKDFYCAADAYDSTADARDRCRFNGFGTEKPCDYDECSCYRRIHPTPAQYKKEYGKDVPDDMAVYILFETAVSRNWTAALYSDAKASIAKNPQFYSNIVIACTPFGSPEED